MDGNYGTFKVESRTQGRQTVSLLWLRPTFRAGKNEHRDGIVPQMPERSAFRKFRNANKVHRQNLGQNRTVFEEGGVTIDKFLTNLTGVRRSGDGWVARCPAHNDQHPSLSVKEVSGTLLVHCHTGCTFEQIMRSVNSSFNGNGHSLSEVAKGPVTSSSNGNRSRVLKERRPEREFDYTDGTGKLLYKVVRTKLIYEDGTESKQFRAKRPVVPADNSSEDWIYKLDGVSLVLYRLPEVAQAAMVYVVEGEKDVETLRSMGLTATCNPFGAGKWRQEFNEALKGKTVVILPDNDEPGRAHATAVATSLHGIAKEILPIELPGLNEKGDVTDFVAKGHTVDDLIGLVERAEPWTPPNAEEGQQKLGKFRFTSVRQLLTEPDEETAFIWDETLPAGGLSICSAKPKVGKSTLARNLAVAIASGRPFLGRSTIQGRVLYLCLEEKRSEIRNHFERMQIESEDIHIYTGRTPDNPIPELAIAIADFEPVLIIIDPLSRVLRVRDFNDYALMARGFEPLIDLARKTNCHILALHHDSKLDRSGGDALLGSTAIFGAVDCHIQLRKRDKGRTIATTQRYGEDLSETVIDLDKITGVITAQGDLQSFVLKQIGEEIRAVIRPSEILTEKQIKERIEGYSQGAISKAVREMLENGELQREGEGKKSSPFLYRSQVESDVGFLGKTI
jgi:putative DNA primase/helicase